MTIKDDRRYKTIYPKIRHLLNFQRHSYLVFKNITSAHIKRNSTCKIIPNSYTVCNITTSDNDVDLNVLYGELPQDLNGNLYICQCLGTPEAYMVGETNLVKINFSGGNCKLKNRFLWHPCTIAKSAFENTKHKFDHYGVMMMSPGLGMFSYAEGLYVLPDGRIAVTGDVDRPWIVDRHTLQPQTPLGKRTDWIPMINGQTGEVMGPLFPGYSNSHAIYTDTETNELFLVNYQFKQSDGSHPCKLMKWCGDDTISSWRVVDESENDIRVIQSLHELIFTRDYIILADTAFATGTEMISQWRNAPLPLQKTVVYIIDRRQLKENTDKVVAKKIEIDQACIHLVAEYENPNDVITVYMLHTPATNTAEIIRSYDKDLNGKRFPKHLVGYGTLPTLDVSSIGKHHISASTSTTISSSYIRDNRYSWGPYMYTYMGRQTRAFHDQDLFVMFKGFHSELMPKRIYDAYKNVQHRHTPLCDMFENGKISSNNSIVRIKKDTFELADVYSFPNKVFLYTISCLEGENGNGYILAGVACDIPNCNESSGHEYWLFNADSLHLGPICKLGHKSLNNSILFHNVYLTHLQEQHLDKKNVSYHVCLREDFPAHELSKWDSIVHKTFDEIIWPYFDKKNDVKSKKKRLTAIQHLNELSKKRVAK